MWSPGSAHPRIAHVFASKNEERWDAESGYVFANPGSGDGKVVWRPNLGHDNFKNVRSTRTEGQWLADPGYVLKASGQMVGYSAAGGAVWSPGRVHPDCPKVIAGKVQDRWEPAAGHVFISDRSFTVVAVRQETVAGNSSAVMGEAVVNGFIGLVAHLLSKPRDDDGAISTAGKWAVGEVGDHFGKLAVEGAIRAFNGVQTTRTVQVGSPIPCEFSKTVDAYIGKTG